MLHAKSDIGLDMHKHILGHRDTMAPATATVVLAMATLAGVMVILMGVMAILVGATDILVGDMAILVGVMDILVEAMDILVGAMVMEGGEGTATGSPAMPLIAAVTGRWNAQASPSPSSSSPCWGSPCWAPSSCRRSWLPARGGGGGASLLRIWSIWLRLVGETKLSCSYRIITDHVIPV